MTSARVDRTAQVVLLLRQAADPLDDDQIAQLAAMNRHYVNAICRRLAERRLIVRFVGSDGKVVNAINISGELANPGSVERSRRATRRGSSDLLGTKIEELIDTFACCVSAFEERAAFPGPSLYFHERAIGRRRRHQSPESLLADTCFLEYVYAVLPAWGMHRMGNQPAKVGDFDTIVAALRAKAPVLEVLWPLRLTTLNSADVGEVARLAWEIIADIRVSTSRTQIVAGSKTLHHLLPDLIPPIDRQYTFTFFTGNKAVPNDREAFLAWMPHLAEIASRSNLAIRSAIDGGGFMATGEAKVVDNAIIGYVQTHTLRSAPAQ